MDEGASWEVGMMLVEEWSTSTGILVGCLRKAGYFIKSLLEPRLRRQWHPTRVLLP